MKKQYLLLTLLSFLFVIPSAKASHVMGGEISWKCLNNGQYVFYMTVYRDCTGAGWNYNNESIEIYGNPKPKDNSNSTISSILLRPDSVLWLQRNKGDLSPSTGNPNTQLSCANADAGAIQAYYYQSDTITLIGKPPASGWDFIFTPLCCRTGVNNLASGGGTIFKASMYAYKDTTKTGCQANAPKFPAKPTPIFCFKTAQQTLKLCCFSKGC